MSSIGKQWLGAAPKHILTHCRLYPCNTSQVVVFAAGTDRSVLYAGVHSPAAPGWRAGSRSCGWSRCWWSGTRWAAGATGSPRAPPRCSPCAARATRSPARWPGPPAAPAHLTTMLTLSLGPAQHAPRDAGALTRSPSGTCATAVQLKAMVTVCRLFSDALTGALAASPHGASLLRP